MSAFGRRNGAGGGPGGRPSFGVARPMKGPAPIAGSPPPIEGGEQFPPLDSVELPGEESFATPAANRGDAMSRLADRQAGSGDAAQSRAEGFEASILRIKELVLPRLLERVDPEAAATLS